MSTRIHTLDLHYLGIPQAIAAFVVIGPDGPVLIETGPASTLPTLERELAKLDLKLADIRHALVTHIHLDHAGAAGHLARNGTRIYVHEFGARHLIDPSRLIDSATRIYKGQMDRLWGEVLPVPADRITPVHDGDVIDAAGIQIRALETPGHARHHHAFALDVEHKRICFAGDAAGFNAPAVNSTFISVPTPPPEFDLETWLASIDRLEREQFQSLYLTHFGHVNDPASHLRTLRAILPKHVDFVRMRHESGQSREDILREYIDWNSAAAAFDGIVGNDFAKYVSRNLLTMNVDGILRYLGNTNRR
jgi:glyoxylase-like metal-dependent hydrolase (beta-lactamase superfamily II)